MKYICQGIGKTKSVCQKFVSEGNNSEIKDVNAILIYK